MDSALFTGIPVQNRFNMLATRENVSDAAGHKATTPSVSRDDFESSTMDNKLIHMFDELRFIRQEQVNSSLAINSFHRQMNTVNEKLNKVIHVTNTQTDIMKTLAYKSVDMEARSRRNNLIFRGFIENAGENCAYIIRDFLQNRLEIDSRQLYIARCHRLGRLIPHKTFQNRPIIVNFRDFGDTELVMSKVRMLKGSQFSVDYDFPREIQEARGRLWPRLKETRRDNPRSRVQIVYPAKLLLDGRVVCDALPDWNKYIGANRISVVNEMSHIKQQRVEETTSVDLQNDTPRQQHRDMATNQPQIPSYTPASTPVEVSAPPQPSTMIIQSSTTIMDSQPSNQQSHTSHINEMTHLPTGGLDTSMDLNTATKRQEVPLSTTYPERTVEETNVKSLQCNATNPLMNPPTECIPTRGRSRVSRSAAKTNKRSQSAVPYRRQSVSKTRVVLSQVLPSAINSQVLPSDINSVCKEPETNKRSEPDQASNDRVSPMSAGVPVQPGVTSDRI